MVAGRASVDHRRFPGAMAIGDMHDQILRGPEDPLQPIMAAALEGAKLGAHEIGGRTLHRRQHAVGNVRRAGVEKEVAARCAAHDGYPVEMGSAAPLTAQPSRKSETRPAAIADGGRCRLLRDGAGFASLSPRPSSRRDRREP